MKGMSLLIDEVLNKLKQEKEYFIQEAKISSRTPILNAIFKAQAAAYQHAYEIVEEYLANERG